MSCSLVSSNIIDLSLSACLSSTCSSDIYLNLILNVDRSKNLKMHWQSMVLISVAWSQRKGWRRRSFLLLQLTEISLLTTHLNESHSHLWLLRNKRKSLRKKWRGLVETRNSLSLFLFRCHYHPRRYLMRSMTVRRELVSLLEDDPIHVYDRPR